MPARTAPYPSFTLFEGLDINSHEGTLPHLKTVHLMTSVYLGIARVCTRVGRHNIMSPSWVIMPTQSSPAFPQQGRLFSFDRKCTALRNRDNSRQNVELDAGR